MSKHTNKANFNGAGAGPGTSDRERLDAPARTETAVPSRAAGNVTPGGSISRMLALNWKLIAAVTLAAAGIAWILSAVQPDRYRASALAAVSPVADSLEANEVLRGVEVLERRTVVATIAALASIPSTRERAAAAAEYDIEAAVLPNTNLFRIDVEGADPAQAAAIANRVPEILSAQTRAMYKYYGVSMVSPATRPSSPFMPRTGRAIASGLLIGLFLGLLAAYVNQWRAARRGIAA